MKTFKTTILALITLSLFIAFMVAAFNFIDPTNLPY